MEDHSQQNKLERLENEMVAFTAKMTEWMSTTNEYRRSLCSKIDSLNEKMSELPCKERKGWYDSISKQVGFMWAILAVIVAGILLDWVKIK